MSDATTIRVTFRRRAAAHIRKRERKLSYTAPGSLDDALAWARSALARSTGKLAADVTAVVVEILPPRNGKRPGGPA